ncbi:cell wall hydrolase [Alicyclobacillus sendaiensis]|uniref:cell wall hydrolase n=1 Tax=Alicyclobacillus sendaiensis TaxID=192387 RepID=UPI0026F44528|nr:cell wall hydrolase [Alicyclobacillus sendaiensis]
MHISSRWIAGCATAVTLAFGMPNAFASTVTVEPGQSLWTIARAHGLPVQLVEAANPGVNQQNLSIGSSVEVPEVESVTIKPGDTLFLIGKRYGVSTAEMLAANPAVNPLNLQIGSTVRVPVGLSQPHRAAQAHVAASIPATSSNLYWLEHVIHAEAGGEPLQAQIAVGDVVVHRMQAGGYGNTVQQVVFQVSDGHYQFESVANGYINSQPDAENVQAALDVLNGDDVVPGALVFYNPSETPSGSWVWQQPVVAKIGHLVFAK